MSNAPTLVTSVNEQLYLCIRRSTMPVWPSLAASITGVTPCCRKHRKWQAKGGSGRKCKYTFIGTQNVQDRTHWTRNNMLHISGHCYHSMNLSQFCSCLHISVTWTPPKCIVQHTTGPPASLTTHLGTSSGVKVVLIDQNLNHFSMAFISCIV